MSEIHFVGKLDMRILQRLALKFPLQDISRNFGGNRKREVTHARVMERRKKGSVSSSFQPPSPPTHTSCCVVVLVSFDA